MTTLMSQSHRLKEQLPAGSRPFARHSLRDLADEIVCSGHDAALKEFHDHRRPFHLNGKRRVVLAEFVEQLKLSSEINKSYGYNSEIYNLAYDLTIDKFTNLPLKSAENKAVSDGPDRRYYFQAYIECLDRETANQPLRSPIECEYRSCLLLQKHVTRHFHLSCLECKRRVQRLARRYLWRIDGHAISVWLPFEISGRQCRTWLEEHVPDVDPERAGEQNRIQMVVDRLLARRRFTSYRDVTYEAEKTLTSIPDVLSPIEQASLIQGLAQTVAEEKVETIDSLRPAIRRLGENQLRQMIMKIFDRLENDCFEAAPLAVEYGISNATFSRFAGLQWSSNFQKNQEGRIPDLWMNMAHTLSHHRNFMESARDAGVWPNVKRVLKQKSGGQ